MSSYKQNITLDDTSPLLSYEGWVDPFLAPNLNYFDNTLRYTIINGSSIQLTFIGTGVWVYPGQPWGSWHVTLDGVQQGTFAPARQVQDDRFQLVYSVTDLNLTSNTLFITVGDVRSTFAPELMPEMDRMVVETSVEGTRSIVHASDITTWTQDWTNTADYYYTSTGASFSYSFQGNAIEVWGPALEYGHFTVKLDNQPLFSAPTYAGNPGNTLQVPSLLQFQAAGLDNSINHTIVVANNPGTAATKYAFGFFNIYSLNNTGSSTSSTSSPSPPSNPSPTPSSSTSSPPSSSHTAAISGGVVGGVLLLLVVCILLYLRRRRARSSSSGRLHRTVSLDMSLNPIRPVLPTPEPYQYHSTNSSSGQITSKSRVVNTVPSPDSPITDRSLPPAYDDLGNS